MDSVFNVALMGTSLTTWEKNRNWPNYLERALQVGKGQKVTVHCMGASGETSSWGFANIQPVVNLRPDVLLVEFINDAFQPYQAPSARGMTPNLSASNFASIINATRYGSPLTRVILFTLVQPRVDFKASFYPTLDVYDTRLREVAKAYGVEFVDLRAQWGDPANYPSEYVEDGVHVELAAYLRAAVPKLMSIISPSIQ